MNLSSIREEGAGGTFTMIRVTCLLLFSLIRIECFHLHTPLEPVVKNNVEVSDGLEIGGTDLEHIGKVSMRKEELCMLRQDPEIENSDLRYCISLQADLNINARGSFEQFLEYFKWLKLDVVNSVIPGDNVGPLGVQLTFGLSSKHFPKGSKHEVLEKQLANVTVIKMILKDIFGSIKVDCKSGPRKYTNILLDTVLASSKESDALHLLFSRPLFDSFTGFPITALSAQFDNLEGFWHGLLFFGPEKSQFCQFSPFDSQDSEDVDQFYDKGTVFPQMLIKKLGLWHQHPPIKSMIKQSSLLLNHEETSGLLISYCEIGSQKSHSKNAYMFESAMSGSPSKLHQDCGKQHISELEVIELQRMLIGSGAHRQLSSTMKFKYQQNYSTELNHRFCEILMMERLPSGVFADPFELQRLVHRGGLSAAYVYGDTNLELPSQHSHQSIVEVHVAMNADSGPLSGNHFIFEHTVELPLHARYPPLGTEGYSVVSISIPHMFLLCEHETQTGNNKSQTNVKTEGNKVLSWITWDSDASHSSEVLKWRIPAGNQLHVEFVSIFTGFSALVSVVAIFVASLYSLKCH